MYSRKVAKNLTQPTIVRFVSALGIFVATLETLLSGSRDRKLEADPAKLTCWEDELPHLKEDVAKAQRAWSQFRNGDSAPIYNCASKSSHLSKRLDGFYLDFAGSYAGKLLDDAINEIVASAYAVTHGPGAIEAPEQLLPPARVDERAISPDELLLEIKRNYERMGVAASDASDIVHRIREGLSRLSEEQRQTALEAIAQHLSHPR